MISAINDLSSIEKILNLSLVPCELLHELEDNNKSIQVWNEEMPMIEKSDSKRNNAKLKES